MIKLQALEDFSLQRFNEIKDIKRSSEKNDKGMIYKNDILLCEKDLAEYLCGKNPLNRAVVNILEVEQIKEENKVEKEEKKVKKTTKRSKK